MKRTFFSRTKRLLVVPAAALGIALAGCGGGGGANFSSHSNEHRLVGTWVEEKSGKTLTLNADGSCSIVTGTTQDAKTAQGQWGISENEIVTTLPLHLISGAMGFSGKRRVWDAADIQKFLCRVRKYFLSPDGKTLIIIKEEAVYIAEGVVTTYATYKKKEE